MKLQKNSITAALLIAGMATLYTSSVEAFALRDMFSWFGAKPKADQLAEQKDLGDIRTKTTPKTATTRADAVKIAIPAFKPTTAVEKIGHLDEFEVSKTFSTKDLNTNVVSFVAEDGQTTQFNVESSVDFIFLGNQIVGKDRYSNNWYIFRKSDNPDQPITAVKADGATVVENSNPMGHSNPMINQNSNPMGHSNPMIDQNSNPMGHSNPMIDQNSNPMGHSNPMINQNSNPMGHSNPMINQNSNPMGHSNPMAPGFTQ